MGSSQSRIAGLSRDREEDVPEHLDTSFPGFFWEKSGSQEMAFGNADPYLRQVFLKLILSIHLSKKTLSSPKIIKAE